MTSSPAAMTPQWPVTRWFMSLPFLLADRPVSGQAERHRSFPRVAGRPRAHTLPVPPASCGYHIHHPRHPAGAIPVRRQRGLLQQARPGKSDLLYSALKHSYISHHAIQQSWVLLDTESAGGSSLRANSTAALDVTGSHCINKVY